MAIARIATNFTTGGNSSGASSLTYAYTVDSGTDKYLIVMVTNEGGDTTTGVTANGVAMTQLKKVLKPEGYSVEIWGLAAPTTGNIVVSRSNSSFSINSVSAIYTGVSQTGQPDATNSYTGTNTSQSTSITTVANNSWAVLAAFTNIPVASTGATDVGFSADTNKHLFDTNGNGVITPAGTYTMNVTWTGSSTYGIALVSLAPTATATYTLACAVGTFALTGISAGLFKGFYMGASVGSFVLTGINAILSKGFGLVASVGNFTFTGQPANLLYNRIMTAVVGAFTLTGISAVLNKGYTLIAGTGTFILTGISAVLRPSHIWSSVSKNTTSWTPQNKS